MSFDASSRLFKYWAGVEFNGVIFLSHDNTPEPARVTLADKRKGDSSHILHQNSAARISIP